MSLTFPNSPSTNDTHVTGGSTWIFNGEMWVRQGTTGAQGLQGTQGTQGLQGLSNQGVQGLQGLMGIQGRQGVQGTVGADGNFGGATFNYVFNSAETDADPGAGKFAFDDNFLNTATKLYIDDVDNGGDNIEAFLRTIDDSTSTIKGHVRISNRLDASDFTLFTITGSNVEATGYHKVSISYVSGGSSFTNGEDCIITFARTGTKGDTGATGSQGVQGLQGLKGSQGVQGLSNQGVQGLQGILGTAGSNGSDGAQGTTGTAGSNGSNGAQGTAGTAAGGGIGVDYDDNIKVRFGDDEDIEQFFDGTRFTIQPKSSTTTSQLDFEVKDQIYIHSTSNGVFLRGSNQSVIDMYGGSGGGIYFYHNGNSKLKLEGGNWTTQGNADWNFIGTNYDIRFDASDGALEFEDNAKAKFGTGDDLQIHHNANHSIINNSTGDLRIESDRIELLNNASNEFLLTADANGAVALYYNNNKRFETLLTGVKITGGLQDKDGQLGTSGQVLSSTGSQLNWVDADSGPQGVQGLQGILGTAGSNGSDGAQGTTGTAGSNGSDGAQGTIGTAGSNGSDGAQGIAGSDGIDGIDGSNGSNGIDGNDGAQGIAGSDGIDGSNGTNGSNGIDGNDGTQGTQGQQGPAGGSTGTDYDDNVKVRFGTGNDLEIFHSGSHSRIHDAGTGVLAISGSEVHVQNSTQGETCAKFKSNAEVELRYDNAIKFVTTSSGVTVTGSVTASSDLRLKKNIKTLENSLDKVCKLRGVEFDFIDTDKHNIGVIAQEVEEVLSDLVQTDKETDMKSVAYGNLTAVLIEAVKELKKENDALSARIQSLEDR